jgi:hypothetical protein
MKNGKSKKFTNIYNFIYECVHALLLLNELLPFSVTFDLTFPLVLFPILILHKKVTNSVNFKECAKKSKKINFLTKIRNEQRLMYE